MAKKYLKVEEQWFNMTWQLTDECFGRLIRNLFYYAVNRQEQPMTAGQKQIFDVFKGFVDREKSIRDKRIKARENKTEQNSSKRNKEKDGEKDKETKKESNKEKRKEKEREGEKEIGADSAEGRVRTRTLPMKRPTVEEISEFCTEKGYSVNAEDFYAYYSSNGWMVGKNPMRDWKAALSRWQIKENKNLKGDKSYDDSEFRPLTGFKHGSY